MPTNTTARGLVFLFIIESIIKEFGNADIEIYECRGLCSFYAEKGGIIVGFEKKI